MGKFKNWLADQKERREMRAMERFNLREANRMGGIDNITAIIVDNV